MTVNHGGEPGHQRNNIFDNHPQRKKSWYQRNKTKIVTLESSSTVPEKVVSQEKKEPFRKALQVTPMKVVAFKDLPFWVTNPFLDILLERHAARMDRLVIRDIQSIFQYILGNKVPAKLMDEGQPAVELSIPGTNLKSTVTVRDVVNCFA